MLQAQSGLCGICFLPLGPKNRPTRDHVVPRALGGTDHRNITLAHEHCNIAKDADPPTDDQYMFLSAVNIILEHARPAITNKIDPYLPEIRALCELVESGHASRTEFESRASLLPPRWRSLILHYRSSVKRAGPEWSVERPYRFR